MINTYFLHTQVNYDNCDLWNLEGFGAYLNAQHLMLVDKGEERKACERREHIFFSRTWTYSNKQHLIHMKMIQKCNFVVHPSLSDNFPYSRHTTDGHESFLWIQSRLYWLLCPIVLLTKDNLIFINSRIINRIE